MTIFTLTDVDVEPHELFTELVPRPCVWPDKENTWDNCRDEMVQTPPPFDARSIHFQDAFTYCQRTVVPYQQKHEAQLQCTDI